MAKKVCGYHNWACSCVKLEAAEARRNRPKYKEVVAAKGRIRIGEHWAEFIRADFVLGEVGDRCLRGIRDGDYVQVIYRYAKKPWKRGK